jgi:hypothetical protein
VIDCFFNIRENGCLNTAGQIWGELLKWKKKIFTGHVLPYSPSHTCHFVKKNSIFEHGMISAVKFHAGFCGKIVFLRPLNSG